MRKTALALLCCGSVAAVVAVAQPAHAADCSVGSYQVRTNGDVTDDAACIQTALNELGYDSGPVDGWFGPITEGAVIRYQQALGLTVDGEVGSETAGALGVWVAGSSSNESVESNESVDSDSDHPSDAGSDTAGVYEPWISLANCESGGNWSIDTGNGYYGGLQFSWGSWEAVGGSGNPAHASPSEQVYRGELLQDAQGWGAWPTCARIIGLL